jgi:subtilisin-like proprotein convertase family protein
VSPISGDNVNAAIINLFYWNNLTHDVWHVFGFDEAAGNFQENNYGNGGIGSDSVDANAQAFGNCNANFGTPPDGSNPEMNMFTCDAASPDRDGSLDNGVIVHEYGHGISNRLTGGPSNTSCLYNSEQMGEGWSDWFGLVMTIEAGDTGTEPRGIGTWLLGQGPSGSGVREYRYSTDMAINPHTYGDVGNVAVPHGVGSIWSAMLWEVTWLLIEEHGFNPDIFGDWTTGGNNLAMQLVIDGLKLQPCLPGFVDGRDAILLADLALTGGQNECLIWEGFAKRGLGYSAIQGSSDSTSDGIEAFDIPPTCDFLNPTPASIDVCVGSDAIYSVDVNDAFTPPVTMSVSGNPAGSTVSIDPNPVIGPLPAVATVTISSIGAGAVGSYPMTVTGNDGVNDEGTTVDLGVYPTSLSAPGLSLPINGSVDVGPWPALSWEAVPGAAEYLIQIDDDPAFSSVDYSATVTEPTHEVDDPLAAVTTYYWRVTATNLCTNGPSSTVFSFTTANISCGSHSGTDLPLTIPPSGTSGTTVSTVDITASGSIIDVNVTLSGIHTYMGDLDFDLESPAGTTVRFMDTGDCWSDEDFDLTLDDSAAEPFPCPPVGGGTYLPTAALSGFNNEELNGPWTLSIIDNWSGDSGQLQSWSLEICSTRPADAPFFADDFESGFLSAWSAVVP